MKLLISIGALCDGLVKQFKSQGFVATDWEKLSHIQQDIDALVRLRIRGVISDSVSTRASKKLSDRVAKLAIPAESETPRHE